MFRNVPKSYRALSSQALLTKYQSIENQINTIEAEIARLEEFAYINLGYPSLEAAKNGLRMYGTGEAEEKINSFKREINKLFANAPNPEYAEILKNSPQPVENKELLDNIKNLGKDYIKLCETLSKQEKALRVARGVLAEKGVVIDHLPNVIVTKLGSK